jgi:transcriptional regulator with XRE-family HTH domain
MTNEDMKSCIAGRLRLARERAGLSQAQVAKMLGLSRPAVSEMEAARRNVSAHEIAQLAEIYGVDLPWVACQEGNSIDKQKDRLELAARELAKLKPEDLETLMALLSTLRRNE